MTKPQIDQCFFKFHQKHFRYFAVHLGGGIAGIILGPIFSINGLSPEVGGIIYGGHPEAFRVRIVFFRRVWVNVGQSNSKQLFVLRKKTLLNIFCTVVAC